MTLQKLNTLRIIAALCVFAVAAALGFGYSAPAADVVGVRIFILALVLVGGFTLPFDQYLAQNEDRRRDVARTEKRADA